MLLYLVVAEGTDPSTATQLAVANGCCGFYTGIPPVWMAQAAEQGWTLPCVLTDDGTGSIVAWSPVAPA